MNRSLVFVIIALLVAGAALFRKFEAGEGSPGWQGYAEADYVKVGPTQQGTLVSLSVGRGDEVKEGQPLFSQDDTQDEAAVDQARQQLAQVKAQVANLQAGGKDTEIRQAEANLADAIATRDRSQSDLQRAETLLKSGNTTFQNIDLLRAAATSAVARVAVAEAALAQIKAPMGRPGEIEAEQAAVSAAEAALAQAQWRLDQRHVAAPVGGRVADTLALPGETMAAGAPVVSLLPPANIFVRFFVPEPDLARLHRGDQVRIRCDNCAAGLTGTISFVAPQPQYTPPIIYSDTTRAKLVYLIEARPPPEQAILLKPGQPVDVHPSNEAPAKAAAP
ncbi:secretion protein HlyD [Labrys miyagiensis]|uniref:Secretion protein HlyD n=1 Tax=Labrys miyagiensis TaxID=346912 RepID=A0ABQ6CQ03_9HYPH|nr:HlyD family efflux transporter periplasmic adaptor subunit [Labrys miyagiensis]GLS20774.1 secretion protein HlyD [Labrys miyagiensis]